MISLKKLYITSLLLYSYNARCMERKHHIIDESSIQLTAKEIKANISHIKVINQKNERKYIEYLCRNITNPNREIGLITNKLSNIEKQINLEYFKMLEKINLAYMPFFTATQKEHGISDDFWTSFAEILQQTQYTPINDEKKDLKLEIQADQEIPPYFLCMLKENLNKNSIPLSVVYFHYTNHNGYKSPSFLSTFENNQLNMTLLEQGYVDINKNILTHCSLNAQRGYSFAIINHLHHCTTKLNFFFIFMGMTNNNINEHDFSIYTERSPEIQLLTDALKNQENAHLLKNYLKEVYFLKFSMDDYTKIFKIDRLHRILAWLKEHK